MQQLDLFHDDIDQIWHFFHERGVWLTVGHMDNLEGEYPEVWEEYLKQKKNL